MNDAVDDPRSALDRLTPEDLPGLALFVGTYLREELATALGSAQHAAWEYAAEAELDELQELANDWQLLRVAAREAPLETIQRALRERFRSSWLPQSREEIDAVGAELEHALDE
jgi:hypothetical protein